MNILISVQLYALISYSIGLSLSPIIYYFIHKYKRAYIKELFFFWISLTLVSLGYVIDFMVIKTKLFSQGPDSGPLFTLFFATLLIVSLSFLTMKLTNTGSKRKKLFILLFTVVLLITLLLTQWTTIRYLIRFILSLTIIAFFVVSLTFIMIYTCKRTTLRKDPKFWIVTTALIIPTIISLIYDFSEHDMSMIFYPTLYCIYAFYILFMVITNRDDAPKKVIQVGAIFNYEEYGLTLREISIVEELIKGLTYSKVGDSLNISINTVRTHVNNIYKKCGVKSKIELINLINTN